MTKRRKYSELNFEESIYQHLGLDKQLEIDDSINAQRKRHKKRDPPNFRLDESLMFQKVCWAFVGHFFFTCLTKNPRTLDITGRSDMI